MSDAVVSVVIPVRDGERYLAEAIDSVLAQRRPVAEVLVIDDGSSDGTQAIAESYSTVRCIAQDWAGPGAARNRGVAESRGEYLAFLDHDDLWTHDKLELQLAALADDPRLDLVFGHARGFVSPELDEDTARTIVCPPEPQPAVFPGTLLARRESLVRAGGFGTGRYANEFLDFLLRSDELGLRRRTLSETVLFRRLHQTNFHIANPEARREYALALKASLDRRRALGQA